MKLTKYMKIFGVIYQMAQKIACQITILSLWQHVLKIKSQIGQLFLEIVIKKTEQSPSIPIIYQKK